MNVVRTVLLSLLLLGAWLATPAHAGDDEAAAKLKDIVARQKQVFADADKAGDDLDQDNLRMQLQQIGNDYDLLLRRNPAFVPAYVSYGLFLSKVDNRREAVTLLLKANSLDPNLPIVKNQLGNYLAEEGKPLEAMNYYLAAIQLEPKEPLYHFQLGTLLTEARDDFLKTGLWSRAQLDKTAREAFHQATLCAPDDWRYAYRYGLCFYDLETPDWDAALAFWRDFEKKMKPGVEQQTCRINEAKILIAQKHADQARALLATVTEPILARDKEKLVAELSPSPAK